MSGTKSTSRREAVDGSISVHTVYCRYLTCADVTIRYLAGPGSKQNLVFELLCVWNTKAREWRKREGAHACTIAAACVTTLHSTHTSSLTSACEFQGSPDRVRAMSEHCQNSWKFGSSQRREGMSGANEPTSKYTWLAARCSSWMLERNKESARAPHVRARSCKCTSICLFPAIKNDDKTDGDEQQH